MPETPGERASETPEYGRAAELPVEAPEALISIGEDISEEEADEEAERV